MRLVVPRDSLVKFRLILLSDLTCYSVGRGWAVAAGYELSSHVVIGRLVCHRRVNV